MLDSTVPDSPKPNSTSSNQTRRGFIAASGFTAFRARDNGQLPPVTMTWYDGGLMPPTPNEMSSDQRLPDNGVLYVGSRGKMYHSSHGGMPQLLPGELQEKAKAVKPTMERSPGHYEEWYQACKTGKLPRGSFDFAGPMTETVLLGVLALRAPGRRLLRDATNLRVTNNPDVNQYIHTEYRKGWSL